MCLNKTPSIFYKYYSMNKMKDNELPRSVNQLLNGTVSFTNITTMNDPCEAVSKFIYSTHGAINEFEQLVGTYTSEMIQNMAKSLSVFCVSETPMNPLMWSHYAQSYQGFCVGYAMKDITSKENNIISFKKVKYTEVPPHFEEIQKNPCMLQQQLIEILSHKSLCWSYENEWRAVCYSEQVYKATPYDQFEKSKEVEVFINQIYKRYQKYITKRCFAKEVYLGHNMPDKDRILLLKFCQFKHIPCYDIQSSFDSYEIKKTPIDLTPKIDCKLMKNLAEKNEQ